MSALPLFALTLVLTSALRAETIGNSVVNCAACRTVEMEVDSWHCKVNCQVTQGQHDDVVTVGVISELIQKMNQLNETLTAQAQEIKELKAPTDVFYAHAYTGTDYITYTDGESFVFPTEIVDRLDSYNNATGVFTAQHTGVYSLVLAVRSGTSVGHAALYLKKPGVAEVLLCGAKGQSGGHDSACIRMQPLEAGDEVYVKFSGSGMVLAVKCYFQTSFLY